MRLRWIMCVILAGTVLACANPALAGRVAGVRQTPVGAVLYIDKRPTSPTIFLMYHWEEVQQRWRELERAGTLLGDRALEPANRQRIRV